MTRERGREEEGQGMGRSKISCEERERKIMSKINKGFQTHVQRSQGLRQRAWMVFGLMAAKGRGGQEKGHKWAETLSGVEVRKVNRVSVKLTPVFPPLFKSHGRVM